MTMRAAILTLCLCLGAPADVYHFFFNDKEKDKRSQPPDESRPPIIINNTNTNGNLNREGLDRVASAGSTAGESRQIVSTPLHKKHIPFQFWLFPGVSTKETSETSTDSTHGFALTVFDANPTEVVGGSVALVGGTRINENLRGVQFAPLYNFVGGKVIGLQLGGVYNQTSLLNGVQIGVVNTLQTGGGWQVGGFNIASKKFNGVQVGAFNWASEPIDGAQLGGVNFTSALRGVQAGAVNFASTATGAQFAGLYNQTHDLKGVQIALGNQADHLAGAQVGFANVAQDGGGFQLGVVNYAPSDQSVSIGILTIPKKGGLRIGYGLDDQGMHHLAIKLGTRYTYSFLEYGYRKIEVPTNHFSSDSWIIQQKGFGVGFDVAAQSLSANIEAMISHMDKNMFINDRGRWCFHVRAGPRLRVVDEVALTLGVSANVVLGPNRGDFANWGGNGGAWLSYFGGVEVIL